MIGLDPGRGGFFTRSFLACKPSSRQPTSVVLVANSMTLYHFDYRTDGHLVADVIGTTLQNFAEARTEAVRALGDLIRDELQGPERRRLAIEVKSRKSRNSSGGIDA